MTSLFKGIVHIFQKARVVFPDSHVPGVLAGYFVGYFTTTIAYCLFEHVAMLVETDSVHCVFFFAVLLRGAKMRNVV